jgi:hypothetical protein
MRRLAKTTSATAAAVNAPRSTDDVVPGSPKFAVLNIADTTTTPMT